MKRKIKFRGKTPKGEWLYGDLQQWNDGTVYIAVNSEWWTDDGIQSSDYLTILEVNPDTVGQFTGLCDKNGKEIYEGDILKDCWADGSVGIELVGFENGSFGSMDNYTYQSLQKGYKYPRFNHKFLYSMFDGTAKNFISVDVIGNIYDTPELLKPNKSSTHIKTL